MRAKFLAPAAAAALTLATPARAAPPQPAATVTFLAGEATRTAAGASAPLAVGAVIYQGDLVETKGRTRLELRLVDTSVVRLGPSSRLSLDEASASARAAAGTPPADRKVSAKLLVGKVWANVAKAVGGDARFEVQTENAVAGVRGTTFRVDAATDRSVVVKVYSGTVAVAAGPIPRPDHAATQPARAERRQVAGPQQVSREQWEKIVTSMMQVRVSAKGVPGEPEAFALAGAGRDEWEDWNRGRDAAVR